MAYGIPEPLYLEDGTVITFWRTPKGTPHAKNSNRIGSTWRYPDGRVVRRWGMNLRQWLNATPKVPGLNQLIAKAREPARKETN